MVLGLGALGSEQETTVCFGFCFGSLWFEFDGFCVTSGVMEFPRPRIEGTCQGFLYRPGLREPNKDLLFFQIAGVLATELISKVRLSFN